MSPIRTHSNHAGSRWRGFFVAGSLLVGATVAADITFVENGAARGIGPYDMADGMAAGMSAADFDADGDIDLFVPNGLGAADQLYENQGPGIFVDTAAALGLDSTDSSRAALWIDIDGDGDLDLIVARDGWHEQVVPATALRVYRQETTRSFTDVTEIAGLDESNLDGDATHIGGLAAGDVDGDGDLDLCMMQWDGDGYLFRNDGDGVFSDISVSSGIDATTWAAWQPMMHDFDGVNGLDLFVAIDYGPNNFWRNDGNAMFTDLAGSLGLDSAWHEMGVTLGDYDNDGDLDIYVTNIHQDDRHNLLYRNDTIDDDLAFEEIANDLGVGDTDWGWGTTFLDADRDGWLDLAVTNGFADAGWADDPSRFFANRGGTPQWFEDVSDTVGFNDTEYGAGLIAFDMDRDGDLDMAQTCSLGGPLRIIECRLTAPAADRHYLVVRPRSNGPNTHAIGGIVRVQTPGLTQMRLITAGTSIMGQEPAEAFFGLGDHTVASEVRVEWPDGRVTILTDVAGDRVLDVSDTPACPADIDGSGAVGIDDLLAVVGAWGPCETTCLADLNGDASVNIEDLLIVLAAWGPCP